MPTQRTLVMRSRTLADPSRFSIHRDAGIDDEVLRGATGSLVGSEKQRHARHMAGVEPELQGLPVQELLFEGRRAPQLCLALGDDGSWHDAIDADATFAELARQRAREAVNRGFRGGVGGK